MAKASKTTKEVNVDRRAKDRRAKSDRRKKSEPVNLERRTIARREKVSRRRQIDPTTCERDYTSDEVNFMQALDEYKRQNGRMFPTCSEILEVIRDLGYVKQTAGQSVSDAAAKESAQSEGAEQVAPQNGQDQDSPELE